MGKAVVIGRDRPAVAQCRNYVGVPTRRVNAWDLNDKIIRFFLVIGTLLASAVAAPAQPQGQDPAAFVTGIYKKASAGKGESGGEFLWLNAKDRPRSMSKSLVALWAKVDKREKPGEIGAIAFDPVTNSQDPLVRFFEVKTEKQDDTTATVAASFGVQRKEPPLIVRYDFVREGNQWKIDDIRGEVEKTPWSVREMLTEFLKN